VRLLAYFGEASQTCGNCDNCLSPPATWDATTAARKALSTIYRTEQRFGVLHLIDVLRGKAGERVQRWDHQSLSVFGIGKELNEAEWRNVLRQLVAMGYARVDHTAYGALRLTAAARPVLRGETTVQMRVSTKPVRSKKPRVIVAPAHVSEAAAERFAKLKAWRTEQARLQAVPAYVILHDATLLEIATRRPRDRAELATIQGIGKTKLDRYGEELIALVAQRAEQGPEG
jgi:ATP-dependent DNA helicase RecQ